MYPVLAIAVVKGPIIPCTRPYSSILPPNCQALSFLSCLLQRDLLKLRSEHRAHLLCSKTLSGTYALSDKIQIH